MRKDALALLIGVTGIQFAPCLPPLPAAGVAAALILAPFLWRTRFRAVVFLALGLIYALANAQQTLSHGLPAGREPLDVQATVEIVSLVDRREFSSGFDAKILSIDPHLDIRRIRVNWYRAPASLRAAQRWSMGLKLRSPRGFRNPGGFDAESLWGRAGIDALATVSSRSTPRLTAVPGWAPVLRSREYLSRVLAGWAAGSPSAGVITGLAVGDTHGVAPELWSVFRSTGITHLMAISGSHVGMFGVFAAFAARMLWRVTQRRGTQQGCARLCVLAAMCASFCYALLAGFSIPSQRTALMIAVVGLGRLRARILAPSRSLSLALIAVLLLDPAAPLQPGFWLSFATVAWIFALSSGAAPAPGWMQALRLQMGVSLIVLPITLYCFAQTSLIAPLVNVIAIPLAGLILVPLIIIAAAMAPLLPDVGQWIVQHLAAALDHAWPLLRAAGELPFAQWWTPGLPLPVAVVGAGAAIALCLLPAWQWRCIAAAALLSVFWWRAPALQRQEFDFVILDAGDALVTVLLTAQSTLVYYRGAGGVMQADVGATVLLPYLRYAGREHVDLLVLSHVDAGYASGLDSLFREMRVAQTIGGGDSQAPCLAGQRFDRDGVAVRVLAPRAALTQDQDASCMLWIGNSRTSVLVPGDATQAAEAQRVAAGTAWPASLVIVPARGSHHSSSPGFVVAVRPRWAVVAAAHLNRFAYPRAEVVARWQAAGAQVRQVSQEGAMVLRSRADGSASLLPGERLTNRRYWTAK